MEYSLALNTIRIIIKAHKFSYGETAIQKVATNQAKLVIIASDAGKATAKKVQDKCNYYKVESITLFDTNMFNNLFNKNISYFAVLDENLAKKLKENIDKGGITNGNAN